MDPIRNHLLSRHAHAGPRLDALRRQFLNELPKSPSPSSSTGIQRDDSVGWHLVWREIFGRARVAWSGLAVAGAVAVGLHAAVPRPRMIDGLAAPVPAAVVLEFREERSRLVSELISREQNTDPGGEAPAPSTPSKPAGTRRSALEAPGASFDLA